MNNMQAQLIYLVSCAIRGKKAEQNKLNNIKWDNLVKYDECHLIKGLIYCALPETNNVMNVEEI